MIRSSRIKVMLGLVVITALASMTLPAHAFDTEDFVNGAADAASFNSQALQDWEATLSTYPICQFVATNAGPLTQSTTTDVPPIHFGTQATDSAESSGVCGSPISESLVPPFVNVPADYTMDLVIQFQAYKPWAGHPGKKIWTNIGTPTHCPLASTSGQDANACDAVTIYDEGDPDLAYLHTTLFTILTNGVVKAQQQWTTPWSPRPQAARV